jgi:uncharacterized membrane protein
MTADPRPAKAPVSAALAGPYGHPFHPILVTVPIGAWVASLVGPLNLLPLPTTNPSMEEHHSWHHAGS